MSSATSLSLADKRKVLGLPPLSDSLTEQEHLDEKDYTDISFGVFEDFCRFHEVDIENVIQKKLNRHDITDTLHRTKTFP